MKHVVVVEDDRDTLEMMQAMLEQSGLAVHGAQRLHDVEALVGEDADLFLVDVMLQGTSGVEVAETLRRHGYDSTPMIAMSASRSMLHAARSSHLFQEAIRKPFDLDTLIDCVGRYL